MQKTMQQQSLLLNRQDRFVCETLTRVFKKNLQDGNEQQTRFLERMRNQMVRPGIPFPELPEDTITVHNMLGIQNGYARTLQQNFVTYLEFYFAWKYDLYFSSFLKEATTEQLVNLQSYEPITDNIASQLGPDPAKAGIAYRMNRIHQALGFPTLPRLKQCGIIFYESFSYDLTDGKFPYLSNTVIVREILAALALFLTGQEILSQGMQAYLDQWKDHFRFNRPYVLEDTVAVKFSPEKVLEIAFPDPVNAALFYDKFLAGPADYR